MTTFETQRERLTADYVKAREAVDIAEALLPKITLPNNWQMFWSGETLIINETNASIDPTIKTAQFRAICDQFEAVAESVHRNQIDEDNPRLYAIVKQGALRLHVNLYDTSGCTIHEEPFSGVRRTIDPACLAAVGITDGS